MARSQSMTTHKLISVLTLLAMLFTAYLYWPRQTASATELEIKNPTTSTVAVRVESDAGALYPVSMVVAGGSAKVKLSGKDQSLRAIALYTDGQTKESEKLITKTKGSLLVIVKSDAVEIAYQ